MSGFLDDLPDLGEMGRLAWEYETLGLTPPRCATLPALHPERRTLCQASGRQIVNLVREGFPARAFLTRESIENAIRVVLAIGGSTNATLHLLAIARAAGVARLLLVSTDKAVRPTSMMGATRHTSERCVPPPE